MKKYFIAAMAASLLILAGCSDKYQSELNMADVEAKAGKATFKVLLLTTQEQQMKTVRLLRIT